MEDHEIACCRETVRRVMAELGLGGRSPRRFVKTTDSNHDEPIAANRLPRDFTATRPDQKWLADITYIRLAEGGLYLAVILDCFSRQVVGWSLSRRIDAALVCAAWEIDNGYATEEAARREVFKYIELFYNPTRRHSALDYLSPAEFERRYHAGQLTPREPAARC